MIDKLNGFKITGAVKGFTLKTPPPEKKNNPVFTGEVFTLSDKTEALPQKPVFIDSPEKIDPPVTEQVPDSPYRRGEPVKTSSVSLSFEDGVAGAGLLDKPENTGKVSTGQWLLNKIKSKAGIAGRGILSAAKSLFGDGAEKEIKKLTGQVLSMDSAMSRLSDRELFGKTAEFKTRIKAGESLEKILPEAYGVVREAASRVLEMKPYREQVAGGVSAHMGRIVEMKTGEGKTLMETMPVYLNALKGDGVHLITANEYLARRDMEEMKPLFEKMGLTVGLLKDEDTFEDRKKALDADVTYGTCSQFGFQYLRDNLARSREEQAGRDLSKTFVLVDEVDSILIDEARTPLIISSRSEEGDSHVFSAFAGIVSHMKEGVHYVADRKKHTAWPTEKGIEEVEKKLGIKNLYSSAEAAPSFLNAENVTNAEDLVSYLDSAIKAKALFEKDVNYMVEGGEIKIIDEFTGRSMPGRRFSSGIHSAIEAKENLPVKGESRMLASISIQNYFSRYGKLSGMTGTAKSSQNEFFRVYGKSVDAVPTHKPVIRKDLEDRVYLTKEAKIKAVVDAVARLNESGRPVLIGTRSIEDSEALSALLVKKGIDHNVLNAKYHRAEAEIISQAGALGAVTIATNMAGRGTDIKLGGDPKVLAKKLSEVKGMPYEEAYKYCKELCDKEKEKVKELGGLFILGTEHSESRRVDDQLRGRAGRQGDPGVSQFFVSLEDETIRWFSGDRVKNIIEGSGADPAAPIVSPAVFRAVNHAQELAEARNLEGRMELLKYDKVMNLQRESFYKDREEILDGQDIKTTVLDLMENSVDGLVKRAFDKNNEEVESVRLQFSSDSDKPISLYEARIIYTAMGATGLLGKNMGPAVQDQWQKGRLKSKEDLAGFLKSEGHRLYQLKETEMGKDQLEKTGKAILLESLDEAWIQQQTALGDLKQGIGLRGYAQQDPEIAFQHDARDIYDQMQEKTSEGIVSMVMNLRKGYGG